MADPVIHFEIIGPDPEGLRGYYRDLFDWTFAVGGPVAAGVSEAGNYGFVRAGSMGGAVGIPGGVGGGRGYESRAIFYVGVPDVERALDKAEALGGRRTMAPEHSPGTGLVVAKLADPAGNLIGLAGLVDASPTQPIPMSKT
jgi:predicted enzyme related to lactoylglutathione lyase